MKRRMMCVLVLAIGSMLLIGGCGKQEKAGETETAVMMADEVSSGSAKQQETETETKNETAIETESEPTVEDIKETQPEKTTDTQTVAESKSEVPETAEQSADNAEQSVIDVGQSFHPGETVEIHFQMPESWSYDSWDSEAESPDWGFSVYVQKREDARIQIFGQHGTLNAAGLYANGPESFETSKGMAGELFWGEGTLDDGAIMIDGMLVFEKESYGVNFSMPKKVYEEEQDRIFQLWKSIEIG